MQVDPLSATATGQKRRFGAPPATSSLPPMNEPASQERAARGGGGADRVKG
jgi:hypothetical protein